MRLFFLALIGSFVWSPAFAQSAFATFDKASEAILNDPHDLTIGPDGRLYVADKFSDTIAILDPETLERVGAFGDGTLLGVHDITFGPDGRAYAAVTGLSAVAVYDMSGAQPVFETMISGYARTEGVLAHSNGRLYVMASGMGRLTMVENGVPTATAGGMFGAHDVAEAPDGTIWVGDQSQSRLVQFSQDLKPLKVLDGPQFGFAGPRYMDFDDFGRIVVADQDAHRILLIDPEGGQLLGALGTGQPGMGPGLFDDPEGVAVHGNAFYFSDSDNDRVVKYVVILN